MTNSRRVLGILSIVLSGACAASGREDPTGFNDAPAGDTPSGPATGYKTGASTDPGGSKGTPSGTAGAPGTAGGGGTAGTGGGQSGSTTGGTTGTNGSDGKTSGSSGAGSADAASGTLDSGGSPQNPGVGPGCDCAGHNGETAASFKARATYSGGTQGAANIECKDGYAYVVPQTCAIMPAVGSNPGSGTMRVVVYDTATMAAVPIARVYLLQVPTVDHVSPQYRGFTDANGFVRFHDVPQGNYIVSVFPLAHLSTSSSLTNVGPAQDLLTRLGTQAYDPTGLYPFEYCTWSLANVSYYAAVHFDSASPAIYRSLTACAEPSYNTFTCATRSSSAADWNKATQNGAMTTLLTTDGACFDGALGHVR